MVLAQAVLAVSPLHAIRGALYFPERTLGTGMLSKPYRFAYLILSLLCAANLRAEPLPALRIGAWDLDAKESLAVTSEAILRNAYTELQQPLELVDLPIRRAMDMMLKGQLDGNFFRVGELAQQQPGLFRVEPPINIAEVRVYTLNPKFKPESWSQLSGLRVGYQRGVLIIERNLPADIRRVEATTIPDLFQLLSRGFADVVLVVEPAQSPPSPIAQTAHIQRQAAVLESVALYHYLLERHREFGQRLGSVLKRMQSSGQMQEIRLKALQGLQ